MEVRREVDEKVSKNGVKQKKRRGLWELRRGGACCCLWPDFFFSFLFLLFAVIHLSVILYLDTE